MLTDYLESSFLKDFIKETTLKISYSCDVLVLSDAKLGRYCRKEPVNLDDFVYELAELLANDYKIPWKIEGASNLLEVSDDKYQVFVVNVDNNYPALVLNKIK